MQETSVEKNGSPLLPSTLDAARWFAEEVQLHEPALRAYLRRQFPTLANHDDVVQESYLKLWRARGLGRIRSLKAYLFAIARNETLAVFRRQRSSPEISVADWEALRILDDKADVVESLSTDQELALALEAIDDLPARCREVVRLRSLDGLSYGEIAAKLSISEHTVRFQMAKGVKRCIQFFRKRGVTRLADNES